MGLFGPYWKTKDHSKTEKIIEKIRKEKDAGTLREIAMKAPISAVQKAAVSAIGDEKILAEIAACGGCYDSVREEALGRIGDDDLLLGVVTGTCEEDSDIGAEAVDRIRDRNKVLGIANGVCPAAAAARDRAMSVCADELSPSVLYDVFFTVPDLQLNNTALMILELRQLTELPKLLSAFEKYDKGFYFPKDILRKLTDTRVIGKIAARDENPAVREYAAAMMHINDKHVLAEALLYPERAENKYLPDIADGHLTTEELAAELENFDEGFSFPAWRIEELSDQTVLRKIAFHDKVKAVRDEAADKLTNPILTKKAKAFCEHASKEVIPVFEDARGKRLAVFETCEDCGRIFLQKCFTGDIGEKCILAEDGQHDFVRKRLGTDRSGVRVCYECRECGQCVYGYEEMR